MCSLNQQRHRFAAIAFNPISSSNSLLLFIAVNENAYSYLFLIWLFVMYKPKYKHTYNGHSLMPSIVKVVCHRKIRGSCFPAKHNEKSRGSKNPYLLI